MLGSPIFGNPPFGRSCILDSEAERWAHQDLEVVWSEAAALPPPGTYYIGP